VKKKTIFRKVALERLSSPDQLDQAMRVTSPQQWLALLTCIGIIVGVIAWSIFGLIPSRIEARGILIKSGGVAMILARSKGQITTLYIAKDELINKGQIVARIDQTELVDTLNLARKKLEELERQFWIRKKLGSRETSKESESRDLRYKSLERQVKIGESNIKRIVVQIGEQEQLVEEGLITRKKLTDSWKALEDIEKDIDQYVSDILQLEAESIEAMFVDETESFQLSRQIKDVEREIFSIELKIDLLSKVISPFTGRIVDIQSGVGDLVKPGEQLMTLERAGNDVQDLELVLYVSPMDGKKVKNNMLVQISPSTVRREEYGYMLGMVSSVSTYPSSQKSMMQILNNEQLVEMFSGKDAPVAIHANLIPSPKTKESPSGYKWSSSNGPPLELSTGTLCTASITIERKRPIFFVMPGILKMYNQLMSLFT
jgi:HlyD family secretion protein